MFARIIVFLLAALLNVTVLTTSLEAVGRFTCEKPSFLNWGIDPRDITPSGHTRIELRIQYATVALWEEDLLILDTGAHYAWNDSDAMRYYNLIGPQYLIYIRDPDLIDQILAWPYGIESIQVDVEGYEGTLRFWERRSFSYGRSYPISLKVFNIEIPTINGKVEECYRPQLTPFRRKE